MQAIGTTTDTIARSSAMAATIAQACVTVGQGGSSNLQRFKAHHSPTGERNRWKMIDGSDKSERY